MKLYETTKGPAKLHETTKVKGAIINSQCQPDILMISPHFSTKKKVNIYVFLRFHASLLPTFLSSSLTSLSASLSIAL
ncbi:hypothetical protein VNO80_16511 [Phaseolus coccineus]|uniref:Uncharacterized protein n=1 Tax=Phaseolus coccineus TaxID=3886 RepID=A0AAN9R2T4_PHACN